MKVGKAGWAPDYGQPNLFDPRTTELPKCGHCGTTAKNACLHDADIAAGIRDPYARRPKQCINTAQLGPDDELPF